MRGELARLRHAVGRGVQQVDPRLADLAIVAVLLIAAAAEVAITRRPIGLRLLPIAFTILPLLLRRRLPAAMFALQFAAALVTLGPPLFTSLVAFFVGMYSIGVYARRRWLSLVAPLAAALILAAVGIPLDFATPPFSAWSAALIGGVGLWVLGSTVHGAGERAREEEEQRALAGQVAATAERARIARELHDAVAHRVSLAVIQAGAARTVLDREPDRARESTVAAEQSARAALEELRDLVGLLGLLDEGIAPHSPRNRGSSRWTSWSHASRERGFPSPSAARARCSRARRGSISSPTASFRRA
ncbi:MAG: histidine kinase dimerization/phosphoacceptor domain-containing protein [Candidatus Dormibacteraceae bacterium]